MKHSHLPHIDNLNYYQLITFRTYDSSDEFVTNLSNENNPKAQLLMDEHLVKIPEDLAMTITAELEEAEWRELAKVFMDDVWAECLAIANGDASDK